MIDVYFRHIAHCHNRGVTLQLAVDDAMLNISVIEIDVYYFAVENTLIKAAKSSAYWYFSVSDTAVHNN